MKKITGLVFVAILITLYAVVNNSSMAIAQIEETERDEFAVLFEAYPDEENKFDVQVYNRSTGEQVLVVMLENLYMNHYHSYEVHNGNLYVIKEFMDASGENYTRELWLYNADGERLLFTAEGIDFRVAPDESWIALVYPPQGDSYARVLGFLELAGGELVQEFGFDHISDLMVDLGSWSDDSGSFWVSFQRGPAPSRFSRINTADWSVVDYDPGDLFIGSDYDFEPNSGQIVYSDHPTFFEIMSAQAFAESGNPVSLFVYNIDSGVAMKIAESAAKPFDPFWIDGMTVAYNDPEGDGSTILTYTILSGEVKSLEAVQSEVFPEIIPAGFETYVQALVSSNVPPILPVEFPVEAGLPAIYPYISNSGEGIFELSLDYGEDCRGAGACHYGSMLGKKTKFDVPFGSENMPVNTYIAEMVILDKGIQGYFVESQCGASCSDAQVFWVYDGFEYMFGIKAGLKEDVIALANAAIENSIP